MIVNGWWKHERKCNAPIEEEIQLSKLRINTINDFHDLFEGANAILKQPRLVSKDA